MYRLIFIFVIIILPFFLFGQKKKECFQSKIEDESVFTKVESPPYFIGGQGTFQCFLKQYSSFHLLADELLRKDSVYLDTARVRFIISRYGVMSDLSVTKSKSDAFKKEMYRMIKVTACSWTPGNFSGRLVNGWVQMDFFFMLKRNDDGFLQHNFIVKYYDYKTDD